MEETAVGVSIIFWIIILVVAVLQIILFFKIWGMTNDVRELKEFFLNQPNLSSNTAQESNERQENEPEPDDFANIKGDFMDRPNARKFAEQVYQYHITAKKGNYTRDTEIKGLDYIISHYGDRATRDGFSPKAIIDTIIKQLDK